jgi:adenylate kinase
VAEKTPLGQEAVTYINRGALVPDDVILGLVAHRIGQPDCVHGFLFDGFPRTIGQADGLQEILARIGERLDGVLSLEVPSSVVVDRLSGRRSCKNCGAMYHVAFNPPQQQDLCDRCQGPLYQRSDDNAEIIKKRLEVYAAETAPLVNYYRQRGLLHAIDGVGSVEDIHKRALAALGGAAR